MKAIDIKKELVANLRELHLPAMRECFVEVADRARAEALEYENYLFTLVERECEARRYNRIAKRLQESRLPVEKTFNALELGRFSEKVRRQLRSLCDGTFLDRHENLLLFGQPGTGKSHIACALGQEWIRAGKKILFISCSMLVQELLLAKKELRLARVLKKFSRFDAIVIDDIGYVQHDREEMEVLFTLLADRYERGSMVITSNLPFSKWEQIFKDPMTTAAAIDRVVHHSIILELNIPSYRVGAAKKRKEAI